MACFNEDDMTNYMGELGVTVTVNDIPKENDRHFVQELKSDIRKTGIKALFTLYAPLVALMKRADKLQESVQKSVIEIVTLALESVRKELKEAENKLDKLSDAESKHFQIALGVAIWISHAILEEFSFFSRMVNSYTSEKKSRGRLTLESATKAPFGCWVKGKDEILEILSPMLKMNILPVWNTNKNLSNKKIFFELIMHSLVRSVKFGARDIMRNNIVSDVVCEIFEHFIKELDMEEVLVKSLVFNIVDSEDTARAVCKILIGLRRDREAPTVIQKSIARAIEIVQNPEHYDKLDKGFTVFIVEIGTAFPEEIQQHSMPYILQFADSEVVALRNAVVSIIAEILQRDKAEIDKGKETTQGDTYLRKELLGYMESFLCDVNAVVRSKAVNLASKLVENNGLLIEEVFQLANEIVDRILDSAATTRKNAFNFFCTCLNSEPIIAKYTPDALHEYALGKRKEFMEERLRHVKLDKVETIINIYVKEFTDHINKTYMGKALRSRPLIEQLKTPDSAVEHIRQLVMEMKIWEACECFYLAVENYAEREEFKVFVNNHTFDIYRTYIGREAGTDLEALTKDTGSLMNQSAAELLESGESEASRKLHHHLHVVETISEFLATKVIPISLLLLENGAPADQTEALGFFGNLSLFDYPLSPKIEAIILDSASQMTRSATANILEPFCMIFFKGGDFESSLGLMKCLVGLLKRLGPKKRRYVNFLIKEMVKSKKIHVPELKILWDIVALKVPQMDHDDSKVALYILYVCGTAEPRAIRALFDPLLEIPLGQRGLEDMEFAHLGLMTLNVHLADQQKTQDYETARWPSDFEVFGKIHELIQLCLSPESRDLTNDSWPDVVNLGISMIYNYCCEPELIILKLAKQGFEWFFGDSAPEQFDVDPADVTYEYEMTEKLMWKFLVFARAMTSFHFQYYNVSIMEEVKKQLAFRRIDNMKSAPDVKRRLRRSFVEIRNRRKSDPNHEVTFTNTLEDSILKADNEELETVVGQIGFDEVTENLRRYIDSLPDTGFMNCYWQVAQHICRRYYKIQTPQVRILTLRLFGFCMLLRLDTMESGMEILIKTWNFATAPNEKIEMLELAILFNDLYPNMIEPYNPLFLSALQSDYAKVRLMAVNFVIFLCQTDIFKLRDILADIIVCLDDENKYIRDATKLFLRNCQEKDTMLHSFIPDMVIRLSGCKGITREKFQRVMKSFLQPFKKVTEVAGIVDKLVERFGNVEFAENLAEDNAYCLSLLNYNERSFKILRDRFSSYSKFMKNQIIYGHFLAIVDNIRQNCKESINDTLNEFVIDLEEARTKFTHTVK